MRQFGQRILVLFGTALFAVGCAGGWGTGPAAAADIYNKYGTYDTSPYDDPRYADLYGDRRHKYVDRYDRRRHARDKYDDRYGDKYGRLKRRYRYDTDVRQSRKYWRHNDRRWQYFGDFAEDHLRRRNGCTTRFAAVSRILRAGWYNLNPLRRNAHLVKVQAYHRRKGEAILTIDRCTGRIVGIHKVPLRYARPHRDHYY